MNLELRSSCQPALNSRFARRQPENQLHIWLLLSFLRAEFSAPALGTRRHDGVERLITKRVHTAVAWPSKCTLRYWKVPPKDAWNLSWSSDADVTYTSLSRHDARQYQIWS